MITQSPGITWLGIWSLPRLRSRPGNIFQIVFLCHKSHGPVLKPRSLPKTSITVCWSFPKTPVSSFSIDTLSTPIFASPTAEVAGQLVPQPGSPAEPSFLRVLGKTGSVVSATTKIQPRVVPLSTKLLPRAICGTALHLVNCWVRCALTLPEPLNSERMSGGYLELLPPSLLR